MMRIQSEITYVRASSESDVQHDRRDAVRNGRRLPYKEQVRLKKIAQRKKRREQRKFIIPLALTSLNVGTLTGKGAELVDLMKRRKISILCLQETRWKGAKAREMRREYKLYYNGSDGCRNGVGIMLEPELKERVIEVSRVSDRVI